MKMLYQISFLATILFLFLPLIQSTDQIESNDEPQNKVNITIKEAKFPQTCYAMAGGIEFELVFEMEGEYEEPIKFWEIALARLTDKDRNQIVTDCRKGKGETTFKCVTFDPPEYEGEYAAYMKDYFETENYVIKSFFLDKYLIKFNKNYIEPTQESYSFSYDYAKSVKGSFEIEFKTQIFVIPELSLDNKRVMCKIKDVEEFNNVLVCPFDIEQFPPDESSSSQSNPKNKEYQGFLKNACFQERTLVSLSVTQTAEPPTTIILLNETDFDHNCRNVEVETSSFEVTFSKEGDCDFKIEDLKLYLTSVDDPSLSIESTCNQYGGENMLSCDTSKPEFEVKEGDYYVEVKEDTLIGYYTVKKFKSEEVVTYTKKNYITPYEELSLFDYDYTDQPEGHLEIKFDDNLTDIPTMKMNDRLVDCYIKMDTLICSFTEDILPSNSSVPTHLSKYKGELINVCGRTEYIYDIEVYKSTIINITNVTFLTSSICTDLPQGLRFTLDFERIGDYEETENVSGIHIENCDNSSFYVTSSCELSLNSLICHTQYTTPSHFEDGNFCVSARGETLIDYYKFRPFKSENFLIYNKSYISPGKSHYEFSHDYYNSDTGFIALNFLKNLADIPRIMVNGKDLHPCFIENKKYLFCDFTKEQLPTDKYFPSAPVTHKGFIINACGLEEIDISVKVLHSKDSTTIWKIESVHQGQCLKPKENNKFSLLFFKDGLYNEPLTINNAIYLSKKLENGNFINLKTSCQNDGIDSYLTCTISSPIEEEGEYIVNLQEDYIDGFVTVKKFNLTNAPIQVRKDYNEPVSHEDIEIFNDYHENPKGEIKIVYNNLFGLIGDLPYIKINNRNLKCNALLNILTCHFSSWELPYDAHNPNEDVSYTGGLMDVCGNRERAIFIHVKWTDKTEKKLVLINKHIDFVDGEIYKKYYQFKINFVLQDADFAIKTNEVYLVNKEDQKIKIKSKCFNLLGEKYFVCRTLEEPDRFFKLGEYYALMEKCVDEEKYFVEPFKSENYVTFRGLNGNKIDL